jgi:hypothetical protein
MAVNSKADKKHAHTSTGLKTTSYSQAPPTVDPLSGKLGTAGQKALLTRAKKVLAPLADPNQAIVD